MDSFDAIVLGTGQGGRPLATALAKAGRRTAIVEKGRVGGTCVVDGCTPTKTMMASARVAHLARRSADYGIQTGPVSVDLARVRERKRTIVDAWSDGARDALLEAEGLELISGHGRFVGDHQVEVSLNDGGTRRLGAPWIFVDTGSRPRVPPLDGLDEVAWLDHASIMELDEVPEHLLVLGGGPVGVEFAQMFGRFGARVTILEFGDRLVGKEDPDVSDALQAILEGEEITVLTGARVTRAEEDGPGVRLRYEGPGGEGSVRGSHLLVAVGRVPNTDDLGLERTGISRTDEGLIRTNARLETGVEGVWALGEVAGTPPFTHLAYDDFRILEANLLGDGDRSRDGRVLVYTLFTDPQLGRVGMTETQARESGHRVRVAILPMEHAARAQQTDETRGFMKAVVEEGSGRILGASILGVEGGEVASVLKVAVDAGLEHTALRDGVFAHPTLAESLNNLFARLD